MKERSETEMEKLLFAVGAIAGIATFIHHMTGSIKDILEIRRLMKR